MDKNILFNELYHSTDSKKHFIKVVKHTHDTAIEEYTRTLEELEAEGKIMYEECRLHMETLEPLIKNKRMDKMKISPCLAVEGAMNCPGT